MVPAEVAADKDDGGETIVLSAIADKIAAHAPSQPRFQVRKRKLVFVFASMIHVMERVSKRMCERCEQMNELRADRQMAPSSTL